MATTEIAHKPDMWINIKLPNNRKVLGPFYTWDQKRLQLQIGQPISLYAVLLFSMDEFVQAYIADLEKAGSELTLVHIDEEDYCPIGYIYLTVSSGSQYTEFDFRAVTSSLNEILLKSKSAHQQFLKVLNAATGVAGLIDVETRRYYLLHDPTKTVYLNEDRYHLDM